MLSHLNHFSIGAEWSILVLDFAKYMKYGCCFHVLTGCAIAVDQAFNKMLYVIGPERLINLQHCCTVSGQLSEIVQ